MARQPRHRQPIIDASVTLFRRQGYSATGVNDIVDASRAPKGSLYHYFPGGKPAIAAAAIEEAGRRVCETLRELSDTTATTGELLEAHARLLSRWMARSGFRDGCPITTVLLELSPRDRAVTDAGRKAYIGRIAILRDKLIADGHPEDRAQRLASLCTSAIQGSLIEARIQRSGKPIENAASELAALINGPGLRSKVGQRPGVR